MTTETEYVRNPEVRVDDAGNPVDVVGPLGVGRIYRLHRETMMSRWDGYVWDASEKVWTDRPRCQFYGSHDQCKNVGKYLEPYGGRIKFDGTMEAVARPDAPRFYLCGIHAPSQEQARARAKHGRYEAEQAERARERDEQDAARARRDAYWDSMVEADAAIVAARDKLIETVRDSGRFPHLVEALDAAIDAHEALRAMKVEAMK